MTELWGTAGMAKGLLTWCRPGRPSFFASVCKVSVGLKGETEYVSSFTSPGPARKDEIVNILGFLGLCL